ncbi:MAG: DNA polymerase III subunit delta [Lachnospiraceae bacterium]|nr:DNA polymerase III subunit delta [Lachnospiraceae bacterium]
MKTIAEDIRTQQMKHIYLLYGEETYLIRQYRDRLKAALSDPEDTMNTSFFSGKEIEPKQLIDLAETMPFFADHRSIFIDQSGFFKKAPEELVEYLDEIPETVYFVFCESEVDRRGKLFKQVKKLGRAVEFSRQKEDVLMRWILGKLQREHKKITRPVMELFLSKTGNDMELIDRELEKLVCYTLDRDVITAEDVEAVCVNPVLNKIFEMVDAIAGKQQKRALELYNDLLMLKEPPMRILVLMTRQFQILMQLKELAEKGFDYKYMAGKAGVPEFAVRKYIGQARKFSTHQIQAAVRDGVQAEEDIKSGRMADRLAIELFLVQYSAT